MRITRCPPLLGVLLGLLVGCTPYATYPPVEGALELSGPKIHPIPMLMAEALRFAHAHYTPETDLVINLPEGTPIKVYSDVVERLGEARIMREPGEAALQVTAVRVRGLSAEVDVIYPRMEALHELVTVKFKKGIIGQYKVDSTRLWRIRAEAPPPHYVPPEEAGELTAEPEPGAEGPADAEPGEAEPAGGEEPLPPSQEEPQTAWRSR